MFESDALLQELFDGEDNCLDFAQQHVALLDEIYVLASQHRETEFWQVFETHVDLSNFQPISFVTYQYFKAKSKEALDWYVDQLANLDQQGKV